MKKNGNTLTQRIIAKQPQVTTVASPQKISFWNIKYKCWAKTAAQAWIHIFSPPVDEVVTENEKNKKTPAKRSLKNFIQKSKTGKRKQIKYSINKNNV